MFVILAVPPPILNRRFSYRTVRYKKAKRSGGPSDSLKELAWTQLGRLFPNVARDESRFYAYSRMAPDLNSHERIQNSLGLRFLSAIEIEHEIFKSGRPSEDRKMEDDQQLSLADRHRKTLNSGGVE
jgi:hypothetical protein